MNLSASEAIRFFLEFLVVPLIAWFSSRIAKLEATQLVMERNLHDLNSSLKEIKVALIGLDGKNGMRSEMKDLKRRFDHKYEDKNDL